MGNIWLITGGAGFIGANFVERAYHCYPELHFVILDSLTYAGDTYRIRDLLNSKRVTFQHGDIRDTKFIEQLLENYDVSTIVHFAAESHVDRSIVTPSQFIETNVEGTYHLLEAARKYWVNMDGKKFIHVSTDEVYGSLEGDMPPFTEQSTYQPNSPYSASKAASDHLVRAWFKTYQLPAIITHCSNNYGPWQHPEKLIPSMIIKCINGQKLPVYGDGLQIRDWIYVIDHCDALLSVIAKGQAGETYNIGGDNEMTNIDVVQRICDKVDELTQLPKGTSSKLIEHVKDRPGHDRRYAISNLKIKNELSWTPKYDFNYYLDLTIRWYLENVAWYRNLEK
ncbi:dTDP-glucose 4,6-dehydratase [Paenibacillus silviterrae]|uniref:dTDP-glucose 4,6-dehydratase n=1 Tax=Paenibacillus silviterrae TaxID=3242194 RepID=UPI002543D66F|nr:dTDP-glucose 4,6-dehydratase [Paenibacillus chinjuensis]